MLKKIFIIIVIIIAIPVNSMATDWNKIAEHALAELHMSEYKPIAPVKYSYIMSGYYDIWIVAINEKTNKKVAIHVFKSKSLLWENHAWELQSIKELP